MKNKWLISMLFILCLWPIAVHLVVPQAKPIPPKENPIEVNATAQKNLFATNMTLDQMCHIAADFGFGAAKEGTSREQMHQRLREILK